MKEQPPTIDQGTLVGRIMHFMEPKTIGNSKPGVPQKQIEDMIKKVRDKSQREWLEAEFKKNLNSLGWS